MLSLLLLLPQFPPEMKKKKDFHTSKCNDIIISHSLKFDNENMMSAKLFSVINAQG